MSNRYLMSLLAAPLMVAALALPAYADSTPTTCKDGSTSDVTGRGACSGHGGVLKIKKMKVKETAAATPAASMPAAATAPAAAATTVAAAPTAKASTMTKAAPEAKASESKAPTMAASSTDPVGATAKCKDGSYSHSKHHGGSCSNHGGVADWLTAK